jgi:predicted nuclease with RNAse H fold
MPHIASKVTSSATASQTVVGIDVGGSRKGFHAVALTGGSYAKQLSTTSIKDLADWCRDDVKARIVAVDAPCRWSQDGRARPTERQLMAKKIWCFSTPTREQAEVHPRNHYGWMRQGEALFKALESTHTLCSALPAVDDRPYCLETFPHAIASHLLAGRATASEKRRQRKALLQGAGIDTTHLKNIDLIDAALCAHVAHLVAVGAACASYGEPETGLIIVPEWAGQGG